MTNRHINTCKLICNNVVYTDCPAQTATIGSYLRPTAKCSEAKCSTLKPMQTFWPQHAKRGQARPQGKRGQGRGQNFGFEENKPKL